MVLPATSTLGPAPLLGRSIFAISRARAKNSGTKDGLRAARAGESMMANRPASEHARLMAWQTRRAKYGPKGHASSYARPCARCRALLGLVIRLHVAGVLSEGQVAQASGLDRVTIRTMADDMPPTPHPD